MHSLHKAACGMAFLTGALTLVLCPARPVEAQNLTYTLSGVTFSDGATATGFFNYNPLTNSVYDINIIANDGTNGDGFSGGRYSSLYFWGDGDIQFAATTNYDTAPQDSILALDIAQDMGGGDYGLGSTGIIPIANFGFGLEEVTPSFGPVTQSRNITSGELIGAPAVPEASSMVSLGLLLLLGVVGVVVSRRRKAVG